MENIQRKQKKLRKHDEGIPVKRKQLTEASSEEEAIPMKKKKKKQLLMKESPEESAKKKRKKQSFMEEKIPEAKLSITKEKSKEKKNKKKKLIGSIVDIDPQSDESAPAKRRAMATDVSFRLLVPSTDLGKVIGTHGARVQQLREDTGAHINIGDAIMNLSERLIWISSKEDSLESQSAAERALLCVATLLIEPNNEEEEIAKIRLLIAGSQANSVVDEAGEAIGKISENTGAIVNVLRKKMFPLLAFASETDRLVQFEGKVSQVLKALELIAVRLRGSPPHTKERKNDGAFKASVEIRIPNDLIGKLIGKNGGTIRQLRQQCGVSLEVDDLKEGAEDRTVHLKGTLSQVTMAQTLLQVFLASKQRAS